MWSTYGVILTTLRVLQKTCLQLCPNSTKWTHRGTEKGKKQADESTEPDYQPSDGDKFKATVFIAVIDGLVAELHRRYHSYKDIQQTFGFLNSVTSISAQDLRTGASTLQRKYASDLVEDFVEEIGQLREFMKGNTDNSARSLLQLIRGRKLQSVFLNVDIALRLFMTLPVTNASGERSFSKLTS